MPTLQQEVHESCVKDPRRLYDVVRHIALFIPPGHKLESVARDLLQSMEYSPPESHLVFFNLLIEEIDSFFPEAELLAAPWWVRVIATIIQAGGLYSQETIDSLNASFEAASCQ